MTRRMLPLGILLAAALAGSIAEARIIHRERSLYSTLLVDEQGPIVCLQFSIRRDQRNQSCIDRNQPERMIFPYTRMMLASLLLNPAPDRLLMLGLGGGTLPLALDQLFPLLRQDVVEIDPAVTNVARTYFGFAPSERVRVVAEDGRVFVKRALLRGERYDLIMLDAFNGEYIPEHLMTREFLEEVRALLTEDGVIAANTFSISDLYAYESATYQNVFGNFFNLKPTTSGNRVIITAKSGLPAADLLAARAAALAPRLARYGIAVDELLPLLDRTRDWPADSRPLTDQYAPANLLQHRDR